MRYRQIAHKLRIQRGPGNPHRESFRPREGSRERGWGKFLDSDEAPTLIEFDALDQVDVPALLAQGAIVEYHPPKRAPKGGG